MTTIVNILAFFETVIQPHINTQQFMLENENLGKDFFMNFESLVLTDSHCL